MSSSARGKLFDPSSSGFPLLCYVTNIQAKSSAGLHPTLFRALRSGVDMIQLREKDLSDKELLELLVRLVSERTQGTPLLVVNQRFDIALAGNADGVHLRSNSIPPEAVRDSVGDSLLIGQSVHSFREAVQAQEADVVDYLFFGPVFDTPSKRAWGAPQGLGKLKQVCQAVEIPVFAIGGISGQTASAALEQGARGLAAIRWFQEGQIPRTKHRPCS